jgi:prolyl-tRNA editing enzyme YbaK/EbsC (Cys-tRNA(Pro) deacylase)
MDQPVFEKIKSLLGDNNIPFRVIHHAPAGTSEDVAKARGTDLKIGGKTILLKVGKEFKLFTFSAARALDSLAIKKHFHEKDRRFATKEELMALTGLESGTVPPFGQPVLPFDHFLDKSITENDEIAFNAGSITDSIVMRISDYLRIVKTIVFDFTKSPV